MTTVFRSTSRRPSYRRIESAVIALLSEDDKQDVGYFDYPLFEAVAQRLGFDHGFFLDTKREFVLDALSRSPRFTKEMRTYQIADPSSPGGVTKQTERAFKLVSSR
jgi:hypothetical protein